jgi:hypothetical protein
VFLSYDLPDLLLNLRDYRSLNIYTRTALAKNIGSIQPLCSKEIAYTHFLNCMVDLPRGRPKIVKKYRQNCSIFCRSRSAVRGKAWSTTESSSNR